MSDPELSSDRQPHWPAWDPQPEGRLELGLRDLAAYVAQDALSDVKWDTQAATPDSAGTQPEGDEQAMLVRRYNRLAQEPIDFWRDPWLPGEPGQRIRHPWLLVHGRQGACLDFATTYAAMCLQASIPPLLALTWHEDHGGHAFVIATPGRVEHPQVSIALDESAPGFHKDRVDGVVKLGADWSPFEHALDARAMLPVDFARPLGADTIPFEESRHACLRHLREVRRVNGDVWLIDVAWLQHHEVVRPLFAPPTRAPIRRYIPGGRARFDRYKSHADVVAELESESGTFVLYGLSGTGKSTIARELAYGAQFGAAWFLTASEQPALVNSLNQAEAAELADTVAPSEQADRSGLASGALARLNEAEDDWVVVIDNADGDPGKLLPWLPRPNIKRDRDVRQLVLVTTTNPDWEHYGFKFRELTPVAEHEAIDHLPGPELAPLADGRPLLFDAFKRLASKTGWDSARIAACQPAPDTVPSHLRGPATLWAAARTSESFGVAAEAVCAHAAYLPPDRQTFDAHRALAPKAQLPETIDLLEGLGLLNADREEAVARLHRLFGAAIRLDLQARKQRFADRVVLRISRDRQSRELLDEDGDLDTIAHLESRLTHLDDGASASHPLGVALHDIAGLLELHGHTRRSGSLYALAKRHLAGDEVRFAQCLHGQARTVNQHHGDDERRLREALEWELTAISMLEQSKKPQNADRCRAMQGLLMQKLANFPREGQTTLRLLHDSLAVIEDADHRRSQRPAGRELELLRSQFNLAGVRIRLARADTGEAAEHLQKAWDVYERVEKARRDIYKREQHPHIAACVIGRAYVSYFRALLVATTRLDQTILLRDATQSTIDALRMREGQEGSLDGDEAAKCIQFLTKVALARDADWVAGAGRSIEGVRVALGGRVVAAIGEITDAMSDG